MYGGWIKRQPLKRPAIATVAVLGFGRHDCCSVAACMIERAGKRGNAVNRASSMSRPEYSGVWQRPRLDCRPTARRAPCGVDRMSRRLKPDPRQRRPCRARRCTADDAEQRRVNGESRMERLCAWGLEARQPSEAYQVWSMAGLRQCHTIVRAAAPYTFGKCKPASGQD